MLGEPIATAMSTHFLLFAIALPRRAGSVSYRLAPTAVGMFTTCEWACSCLLYTSRCV